MSSPVPHIVIDAPHGSDVVASPVPELGWRTETTTPGWLQAGAEIEITRDGEPLTHRVEGRASTRIAWPFAPLAPRAPLCRITTVSGRVVEGAEGVIQKLPEERSEGV